MDKFNEWFDSKYPNFSANQDNEFCKTAKDFAYVAFQHQQAKVEGLQKQAEIDSQLIQLLKKANKDLVIERDDLINKYNEYDKLLFQWNKDEQKLYDINEKHAAEKAELQKRVDLVKRELKAAKEGHYGFNDEGADIDGFIFDLEQALKGGETPNFNIDEKGECRHFSTTIFHEGKAECFHCDAVVNEDREVIGKQSKGFSWTGKEHEK